MAAHVDNNGTCQKQSLIFAFGDVYAAGVRPGEPLFGDLGYWVAITGNSVLVVGEIALGFQIALTVDVDVESAVEKSENLLAIVATCSSLR